jgi:hypothetical protein
MQALRLSALFPVLFMTALVASVVPVVEGAIVAALRFGVEFPRDTIS